MPILVRINKGGPGSGHHGHSGLPGVHGGSKPGASSSSALGFQPAPKHVDKFVNQTILEGKKRGYGAGSAKFAGYNARTLMTKGVYTQRLKKRLSDLGFKHEDAGTLSNWPLYHYSKPDSNIHVYMNGRESDVMSDIWWIYEGEPYKKSIVVISKGGPGSGHHGHRGRPGKRGGSVPQGASASAYANIGAWPPTSHRTATSPKIVAYKPPAETTGEIYTDEPVDMQWINTHMRGVFGSMTPAQAEVIKNYLIDNKIPRSHLEGLRRISHNVPKDYRDGAMAWRDKRTDDAVAAVYYWHERTIYIHPSQSNNTAASLFHEIGHHISKQHVMGVDRPQDISKHSRKVMNNLNGMNLRSWELAGTYGLRPYSLDDWQECFADSYSVLRTGRTHKNVRLHDEAIGNLKSLWGDAPDSVKEVLEI